MNTAPEATYRRFLLGIASEEEEYLVENAILAGEVDASFLNDCEDEVIDDYLLGSITPKEKNSFTGHFLNVDERKQRVAFAAALIEFSRKEPPREPSMDRKLAPSRGIVTSFFWRDAALLATAASIMLAVLAGFQQIKLRREVQITSETLNEVTRLNGVLTAASGAASQSHTFSSGLSESQRAEKDPMPTIEFAASTRSVFPTLLRIPANARFVRIDSKLSLPLAEKYREVVVASTGEQLWAQEFPVSILRQKQSTIVLPSSILPPGLYHFQIERASVGSRFELSEDHVFRVEEQ